MSAAYFIVLAVQGPGFDTSVDGKSLAHDSRALARIAESLGLQQLDDYVSFTPDDSEVFDLIAELDLPEGQWFGAEEGLDWIQKVRSQIEKHPTSVENAQGVLADLAEFERVLLQAQAIDARWQLGVDY